MVDNYSTLSLGYAGLYECVKAMLGVSHTTEKGKEFGLEIMQHLNDKCNEWKEKESIGYSLYGTPKIKELDSMGAYTVMCNEKIA